jgi:hypothetical protein
MLKKTRRRSSSPAIWAVALVVGAPALVQAQTQLFPLAPIQRQRPPCPLEDPIYGLYRHQYYGYFPTCWRQFPTGWGCPSPEAPNSARSFQLQPRDKPPELPDMDEGQGPLPLPGDAPAGPRNRNPPPLPSGERSPFEIDTAPNPGAPGERMPRPDGPGASTLPPGSRNEPRPRPPGEGIEGPAPVLALPDPAEVGAGAAPEASGAPSVSLPARPNSGMPRELTFPNATFPPSPGELPVSALNGMSPPVQAPQRRGPISSLFNGMTSFLRR